MNAEKKRVLEKIKKCLALAGSDNPNEAAAAMRQAQKLMELHGIGKADVTLADIEEASTRARGASRPAQWESALAGVVAKFFGCSGYHQSKHEYPVIRRLKRIGEWVFVGEAAELAAYAMEVLLRQALADRKRYSDTQLKGLPRQIKTARADAFCLSWAAAVHQKIKEFSGYKEPSAAVTEYMNARHSDLAGMTVTDRTKQGIRQQDYEAGIEAGAKANLNHGVNGEAQATLDYQGDQS